MGGWPFAAVSTSNLNCSVVSPRRTRSEKPGTSTWSRSEEHTSELQSPCNLVCRLLLEKKKKHGSDLPHVDYVVHALLCHQEYHQCMYLAVTSSRSSNSYNSYVLFLHLLRISYPLRTPCA